MNCPKRQNPSAFTGYSTAACAKLRRVFRNAYYDTSSDTAVLQVQRSKKKRRAHPLCRDASSSFN